MVEYAFSRCASRRPKMRESTNRLSHFHRTGASTAIVLTVAIPVIDSIRYDHCSACFANHSLRLRLSEGVNDSVSTTNTGITAATTSVSFRS